MVQLGYLVVKDHILLNPQDRVPVASLVRYAPAVTTPGLSLSALLNEFQALGSHMAFVAHDPVLLRHAIDGVNRQSASAAAVSRAALLLQSKQSTDGSSGVPGGPGGYGGASSGGDSGGSFGFSPHSPFGSSGGGKLDVAGFKEANHAGLGAIRRAGLLGLVTLEDVIEVLLTEQVFDEQDKRRASATLVRWMRSVAIPGLRERIASRTPPTTPYSDVEQAEGAVAGRSGRAALAAADALPGIDEEQGGSVGNGGEQLGVLGSPRGGGTRGCFAEVVGGGLETPGGTHIAAGAWTSSVLPPSSGLARETTSWRSELRRQLSHPGSEQRGYGGYGGYGGDDGDGDGDRVRDALTKSHGSLLPQHRQGPAAAASPPQQQQPGLVPLSRRTSFGAPGRVSRQGSASYAAVSQGEDGEALASRPVAGFSEKRQLEKLRPLLAPDAAEKRAAEAGVWRDGVSPSAHGGGGAGVQQQQQQQQQQQHPHPHSHLSQLSSGSAVAASWDADVYGVGGGPAWGGSPRRAVAGTATEPLLDAGGSRGSSTSPAGPVSKRHYDSLPRFEPLS